jgi:hypothetical protein
LDSPGRLRSNSGDQHSPSNGKQPKQAKVQIKKQTEMVQDLNFNPEKLKQIFVQ